MDQPSPSTQSARQTAGALARDIIASHVASPFEAPSDSDVLVAGLVLEVQALNDTLARAEAAGAALAPTIRTLIRNAMSNRRVAKILGGDT